MTIKRAGCYERVSTEEQALHGYSIATQISNLEEYCKKNKIKIVKHYTDEGISGTLTPLKRPALQQLLDDVKAGKIDVVIFTKLDRWFRSVKEYFKVQEILDDHGVEWKAIHEDYDTTTANGRMAITIFLAVAQNESDRAAERIKTVFEYKRKNKEAYWGWNSIPLGYIKEKDENGVYRLVKDPETKDAVQEFWDILVSTNNLNKAIRHMHNVHGIVRNRNVWVSITRRGFYCGVHRGVPDFCEPYVSMDDFLKIQERKQVKNTPKGRVYLFRGILRCPVCGNILAGKARERKKALYKYYQCGQRGLKCTNTKSYPENNIESQLINKLDEFMESEIANVDAELSKPKPKPKTDIQKLKEKKRRLTVVYMDEDSDMSDEEYHKKNAELKALIAQAEATAPPKPKDVTSLRKLMSTDFESLYSTFDEEEKQAFWISLLERIEFDGRDIKKVTFI